MIIIGIATGIILGIAIATGIGATATSADGTVNSYGSLGGTRRMVVHSELNMRNKGSSL